MKRTLCIILALSMIACSMLVMSGCGVARSVLMFVVNDAKKAEYLSLFSDIYYSGGVEIETSFTSITKTEALGGTVTSKNESVTKETIINGNDKDKFAHRTVETVRSSVQMGDGEAQEETYVRSTGFSDGFMYLGHFITIILFTYVAIKEGNNCFILKDEITISNGIFQNIGWLKTFSPIIRKALQFNVHNRSGLAIV